MHSKHNIVIPMIFGFLIADLSEEEEEDSDMENADSILSNVQTTLNQLCAFQKEVLGSAD